MARTIPVVLRQLGLSKKFLLLSFKPVWIKAAANSHKYVNPEVAVQAKFMSEQLDKEIDQDRKKHGKKSLKPVEEKAPK